MVVVDVVDVVTLVIVVVVVVVEDVTFAETQSQYPPTS